MAVGPPEPIIVSPCIHQPALNLAQNTAKEHDIFGCDTQERVTIIPWQEGIGGQEKVGISSNY